MRAGISESTRPAAAKEPDRPQIINNRPLAVSLPRPDEFLRLMTGGSYDISIWLRNTMISMSLSVSVRREDRSRPRIRHRPRQQSVKATADHGRWWRTLPVQGSDRGFGALQLVLGRNHLEAVLRDYVRHHNEHRPHRGLRLEVPAPVSAVTSTPLSLSDIARHDVLGGLIHEYRAAA